MLTNEQLDAAAKAAREWPKSVRCFTRWHADKKMWHVLDDIPLEMPITISHIPLEGA